MARLIYQNNDVKIESETIDFWECKININGTNLIWISESDEDDFIREISEILNKYRI